MKQNMLCIQLILDLNQVFGREAFKIVHERQLHCGAA